MRDTRKEPSGKNGRFSVAILRYGTVTSVPSTRLGLIVHARYRLRLVKRRIKREHLGIIGRIGLLLLPSMSIPSAELSLSSLMHSPIIIPSPIGMELFDACSTMLYSSFTISPRENANRRMREQG